MEKLRLLDLFSGIGGLSLGLEMSGAFQTSAFCEIEPHCQKVLKKHWQNVRIYDDVRTITKERLAADGISVDAICGGFPCTDISLAGKGAGIEGEQSGLWREYARLIGEIRPKYVIVENVSALTIGRDTYDTPTDRCLCGWPYRWGRMPLDTKQIRPMVYTEMRYRDDVEGRADIAGVEKSIWRVDGKLSQGNGKMGSRLPMGDKRRRLPEDVDGSCAIYDFEGGTSEAFADDNQRKRDGSQGASFRIEPEGSERDARGRLVCPSCGRPVANSPTRLNIVTWMGRVLGDLAALGYDAEWHCIQACDVGAYHIRDRVFIIAYPSGVGLHGEEGAEQREGAQGLSCRSRFFERSIKSEREIWWPAEPYIPRVAYGVPSAMDRRRAIGNAVVPQIAKLIGEGIKRYENLKNPIDT